MFQYLCCNFDIGLQHRISSNYIGKSIGKEEHMVNIENITDKTLRHIEDRSLEQRHLGNCQLSLV